MAPQPTTANTSHHHHRLQVQTSHSDHARNVIKSLRGDELIISSGYEQTSECFLTMSPDERTPQWSFRACQMPPQGPWWYLGALVQNDLPLSPRFPIALAPGHAVLGMELSSPPLRPAQRHPHGWAGQWSSPGTSYSPPHPSPQPRMPLWKVDPALLSFLRQIREEISVPVLHHQAARDSRTQRLKHKSPAYRHVLSFSFNPAQSGISRLRDC